MNAILVLQISTSLIVLALGFFVVFQKPSRETAWYFALFALGTALWNFCLFMAISELGQPTLWGRLAISFGSFMPAGFFLFLSAFPQRDRRFKIERITVLVLSTFFFLLALSPVVVKEAWIVDGKYITGNLGAGYFVFWIYYLSFLLISFIKSIVKYRKEIKPFYKTQLMYIKIGFAVFFLPLLITQFILPLLGKFDFNYLGPLFSVPMIGIMSYAIVRHQLLDIRVVIQRGLIYLVLLGAIIGVYVAGLQFLAYLLHKMTSITAIFSAGITMMLGIFFFRRLEEYFQRITDPVFFKRKYNYAELERRVLERTAEIKKLQEEQKQTMIDISHNLQTPMAVIKGELELLIGLYPEKDKEKISVVEKSLTRVSDFIRQLLHLARLEGSSHDVDFSDIDLSKLLREQIEYFEVMAKEKEVDIISSISAGINISGNRQLLEEMFTNLVANAIKYRNVSVKSVIKISLKDTDQGIQLSVRDNGIGITEEDIPKIFTYFYRASNDAGEPAGAGLGLAIVERIVLKHQGNISVSSAPGKGTEFIITFPKANNS